MKDSKIQLPTLGELTAELIRVKRYTFPDPDVEEVQVTLGFDDEGYALQTGCNQFEGVAYGYRNWAVSEIWRRSNCREVARDLLSQASEVSA